MFEWMGDNEVFVKKIFFLFNIYARKYTLSTTMEGTDVDISSTQVQTLEAIMEADGKGKMSEIASKMGITRGTFSNNTKKLIEKGYLEKKHMSDNQKDIFLTVTDKGLQAYDKYVEFVNENCFNRIFELWNTIPDTYKETFYEIIDEFSDAFKSEGKRKN